MSLEAAVLANTAAIEALTAAMKSGGAAAGKPTTTAAATAGKGGKGGKPTPAASKYTLDQVKAAIVKLRDAQGTPAAKEVITEVGLADKMDNIKPENFDAVIAAVETRLSDDGADEGSDDDI